MSEDGDRQDDRAKQDDHSGGEKDCARVRPLKNGSHVFFCLLGEGRSGRRVLIDGADSTDAEISLSGLSPVELLALSANESANFLVS